MPIAKFPPVETADEDGIVAVGGDLEVTSLLLAYRQGIFPWPHQINHETYLLWFSPAERAILKFKDLNFSKSFKRTLNKEEYTAKINHDFPAVIAACANTDRKDQGTWIISDMIESYIELHSQGYAESVGIYREEKLVGGIYGVRIGKYFAAESMFHLESNCSKLALYHLVKYLDSEGLDWLDCQVINPFLASIGVKEIPRKEFIRLLNSSISND